MVHRKHGYLNDDDHHHLKAMINNCHNFIKAAVERLTMEVPYQGDEHHNSWWRKHDLDMKASYELIRFHAGKYFSEEKKEQTS